MDGEEWLGLSVRACDGVVVGVSAEGPLAGRVRVDGEHAPRRNTRGLRHGLAVYAIPRRAVVRRLPDCLVLDVTLSTARGRWLIHVLQR